MILKRYGGSFHEVELNFDSKALTEIGFRRRRGQGIPSAEFDAGHERVSVHELEASAEGFVHDEVEREVLDTLVTGIEALVDGLGEGEVVVIESEQGVDHPKTRARQRNVVRDGENRLHFTVRVEPPLRVGVYRRRG